MLRAFIDDSGSGGDSPWFVLAGYVGTVGYQLVVAPGTWDVFARLANIETARKRVTLKAGETATVNFSFGTPQE